MQFATGILDSLFGEKVIVELPDPNGTMIKRTVTKKWLEKMEQEEKESGLKGIMNHLGPPSDLREYMAEKMTQASTGKRTKRDISMDELLDSILSDEHLHRVIKEYDSNRGELRDIYITLERTGAGGWAGDRYIPAAALLTPATLAYLLRHRSIAKSGSFEENAIPDGWTPMDRQMAISITILTYFEAGKVGDVRWPFDQS